MAFNLLIYKDNIYPQAGKKPLQDFSIKLVTSKI